MDTNGTDGKLLDLKAIETDCWQRIVNGSLSHKDPFHYTNVANVNNHGVNLRLVVLRDADDSKKELVFHTDIRSGKWLELGIDNNISFLFYNPTEKIQIRLSGKATLHHSDMTADDGWGKSSLNTRKTYSGLIGPSSISTGPTSGLPAIFDESNPTPEQSERGRKNFGIVVTKINWMEWMWLNSKGNRRASFHYTEAGDFKAVWLVP